MNFDLQKDENTAVFIDGPHIYCASRALGWHLDYALLRDWLKARTSIYRMNYYIATEEMPKDEFRGIVPLIDFLDYNGYNVVRRHLPPNTPHGSNKRNMEVEIAVDMMRLPPRIDHVILFSGASNLAPAVKALKEDGNRVTVVSSIKAGSIGDTLRRAADQFVDVADLREAWERQIADPALATV